MKLITETLTEIVTEAFAKAGYDQIPGTVGVSDRPDLCQFQCNGAFAGAKTYHKPPFAIAEEVTEILKGNEMFGDVHWVKPGFINMTLSDEYMVKFLKEMSAEGRGGAPLTNEPRKIVMDYGGPNVAKSLHIGHLRSAIIGESVKRLARVIGHEVIADVHLGDWGLQIGLVIAELNERMPGEKCFSEEFDPQRDSVPELTADMLGEIYPTASAKSKEDEEFSRKAHIATYELQKGRAGYRAVLKEILRVSVADLKNNYARLGVDFDYWYGESDADKYIPELLEILGSKGLSRESEGALIADVPEESDKAPMPPVIVQKSDGSSTYATTDLGTIIQRQRDFAPDEICYVVDNRQELHLTQVFRLSRKAGLVPDDTRLTILGFGTINGTDGKPYKTRDGGVMRLSDLIETVTSASLARLTDSEKVAAGDREEYAAKLGMAAIKFGDLINHRSKDYIFDLDKFLSAEGKTGIYLLYTVSRINSVLKKAGETGELRGLYNDADRETALALITAGEAYAGAMKEYAPNIICENAYKTAVAYSRFYHENRIIDEPDGDKRASWLALSAMVREVLVKQLYVLGIETVENM
ncbi:MAG: arginine--tRNA ligase [Ruminococcus sp.]|nr:arginine--tRNA ligase [Ruminococcus sp.]